VRGRGEAAEAAAAAAAAAAALRAGGGLDFLCDRDRGRLEANEPISCSNAEPLRFVACDQGCCLPTGVCVREGGGRCCGCNKIKALHLK